MGETKIDWADKVWNPITGCTKVSAGCKNCYAERMAKRLAGRCGYPAEDPFRVTLHPDKLDEPLRWRKPQRIFVCSMGDLFHEDASWAIIGQIWLTMQRCPQHTFLILTKRPKQFEIIKQYDDIFPKLPNVWLGTSVEDQKAADERIPLLLQTPAAKRFVSYEPALGPVDFTPYLHADYSVLGLEGQVTHGHGIETLDQIIMGGESGPGARPMHPDWARSVRDRCKEAGVPFFFKQWGEWAFEDQSLPTEFRARVYVWPDGKFSYRVGKTRAGCRLDGKEHKELP